jgi:acetylornithine deacetylase/succinyl-diaminopimelate desuccinylase-like protein
LRYATIFAVTFALLALGPADAQQVLLGSRKNKGIEPIVAEISPARIEATIRKLAGFGTRHSLSDPNQPNRGIGAARRWIKAELESYARESGGRLIVQEDSFVQSVAARVPKPTTMVNLVAILPGSQPASKDRWLVVSGHYDSIPSPMSDASIDAPGANDDASGTAVSMELARVMSKHQFDATLVFLAVAGEEQGLLGATHWVQKAKQEGRKIEAMITNDIVGNTHGGNGIKDDRRVRVFSEGVPSNETEAQARARRSVGGEGDGPSRQLARYIKEAGELYLNDFEVTLVFRRDRYGRGGDHIPFNERGYAAVRFTEPNENFNRQHRKVEKVNGVEFGDVVDQVDFAYVAQVARVNAAALASLALAPAPPSDVRFGTGRQGYDTRIVWKSSSEPDLAGYRVVWRPTYQPFWTRGLDILSDNPTKTGEAVVKGLSKDDLFFAVQAVDRDGNASLPSFPVPPSGRPTRE